MRFSFDALKALTVHSAEALQLYRDSQGYSARLTRFDGRCSQATHAGPPNIHIGPGCQEELDQRQLIF